MYDFYFIIIILLIEPCTIFKIIINAKCKTKRYLKFVVQIRLKTALSAKQKTCECHRCLRYQFELGFNKIKFSFSVVKNVFI